MREVSWDKPWSSVSAGRLINKKERFTIRLRGKAAEALKHIARPGARLDRETVGVVMSNISLAALPGLMVFALGKAYSLHYTMEGEDEIVMYFEPEQGRG